MPKQKTIGVTAFKAQCLALIDEVAQGKTDRVVLTKRNRPVALITAAPEAPAGSASDLWGAMRGTVRFVPGVDISAPSGEAWKADS